MRARIKTSFALFLLVLSVAVSARPATAQAAQPTAKSSAAADNPTSAELALEYTYAHSNAPPASCTCFNLNGGSATFAVALPTNKSLGTFAFVTDFTSVAAGGISATGLNLTLSALTLGARYTPNLGHAKLHPYAQALVGFAHAGGTLVQAPNPGVANAGAAFASNLGGGVDLRLNQRFSYRLAEADYLLTTFANGANNVQNNLRISTGVVVHF